MPAVFPNRPHQSARNPPPDISKNNKNSLGSKPKKNAFRNFPESVFNANFIFVSCCCPYPANPDTASCTWLRRFPCCNRQAFFPAQSYCFRPVSISRSRRNILRTYLLYIRRFPYSLPQKSSPPCRTRCLLRTHSCST